MIALPAYALLVWLLAFRWRRHLVGLIIPPLGGVLILLLVPAAAALQRRLGFDSSLPALRLLFWVEAAAVFSVGMLLASMPRPRGGPRCPYCRYSLMGLDPGATRCPECGTPFDHYASLRARALSPDEAGVALKARAEAVRHEFDDPERAAEIIRALSRQRTLPAEDPQSGPDQQHEHRDAERETPAQ
ncbi:hypothetical protein BH11PLA1_BH11PLA1_14300 [soil metagenome]